MEHHLEAKVIHTAKLQTIIPLIDLTLLDKNASAPAIEVLAKKANYYHVAALCLYKEHLDFLPPEIDKPVVCATVINFPDGNGAQATVLHELVQALAHQQVREIDYVFPYHRYLSNQAERALEDCHEVYQVCQKHQILLKVILETGAWPNQDVLYQAALDVIAAGCDFLKTSTGKINLGATLEAASTLLTAVVNAKKTCGIKISGGVRTIEQALSYMDLAEQIMQKKVDKSWFRLGASSLLDEIIDLLHNQCQPHQKAIPTVDGKG